jgi:hypothetical protein
MAANSRASSAARSASSASVRDAVGSVIGPEPARTRVKCAQRRQGRRVDGAGRRRRHAGGARARDDERRLGQQRLRVLPFAVNTQSAPASAQSGR